MVSRSGSIRIWATGRVVNSLAHAKGQQEGPLKGTPKSNALYTPYIVS